MCHPLGTFAVRRSWALSPARTSVGSILPDHVVAGGACADARAATAATKSHRVRGAHRIMGMVLPADASKRAGHLNVYVVDPLCHPRDRVPASVDFAPFGA